MTHRPLQHTKIYTKRSTTATYKWTPTPSFKEHLSLTIPPPDPSREHSRFSADTPTGDAFSLGEFATHKYSPHSKPPDLEDGSAGSLDKWSTTRRFLHFFSSLWASRKEGVALAVPKIPEWRPFNIGRQATQGPSAPCDEPPLTRIQRLRERAPIAALVVFLLYLFINVIILNVRLFSLTRMPVERSVIATPVNTSTTSYELPANTQQCITQYTLNASNDPIGYPCNTCLPLLATLLGPDIEFCTWSGVRCDGTSRVLSLRLIFPAIPVSLPAEFTNLTALEALEIVGDGKSPGGRNANRTIRSWPFPASFGTLTMLTSLHLENTALGALPDTLNKVTSLTLVRNAHVGSSLPPSIGDGTLRSLVVNSESLTMSAAQKTALCGGQLRTCDLRTTGIHACGACLVG
ncbi:hypothetical protein BGW80DRAFT_1297897 [Lactifluus volemus]|nr:hypothetical protein BGW80DRAFT_1297897 [Lactifluus volemus]